MKSFVIAVALLLAIALTAVLTAGATVMVLQQWPDGLPARGETPPPVLRSAGEERRGSAEPVGETMGSPHDDADLDTSRLLVVAPQITSPSDDGRPPAGEESIERDEPAALLVALERSIPERSETVDRPVASVPTTPVPAAKNESTSEPAKTPPKPSAFGSIDYLKLSTDLQHVSETLERFNGKLLRMIATAESGAEPSEVATAPK